ncbi:FAD/FMN-containing protein [Annulohypoxylon moriforme]|nr:FAD/FMN-containing protein [Annulohypoxylon moriforme]
MVLKFFSLLILGTDFSLRNVAATPISCKCAPEDNCWPSTADWENFNTTVSGKLIATQPVALSCYPGANYDEKACAAVLTGWSNSSYVSENPVGLDFPINITCPPINITETNVTGSCSIGTNPRYAVNVTAVEDISATLEFAQKKNLRVAIKSTGHDILGRNDGYGSLEVWLRYFRQGISFQSNFQSSTGCAGSNWTGAAMKLSGGYMWREVYAVAKEHGVVVVGGGSPTVSSTGGWMQGGGHGPASRTFGLGADQVLEAEIVLANGTVITANACQNQDIYFAIRGGGPGTYGVVTSTTIKAWPQVNATFQTLQIAPSSGNTSSFLDALATLHQLIPDLMDAGYSGYGNWQVDGQSTVFGNFTTGYTHGISIFNKTEQEAKDIFNTAREKLSGFKDTLYISEAYTTYPDYWSFYYATSGEYLPVGLMAAAGSRLLDRKSLSDCDAVRKTLATLAGEPGQYTIISVSMVSSGQVSADASDVYSGVLPAWRTAYIHNTVSRIIGSSVGPEEKQAMHDDITFNKIGAMKALAPDTGAYMNEADFNEPDYQIDYYGKNYEKFRLTKAKYDPSNLFYCPQCVGSSEWKSDEIGRLCAVKA